MTEVDLTPIRDALLHEELPKLMALAMESLGRIEARAELARDTGVWPDTSETFAIFAKDVETLARQIRGETRQTEEK